MSASCATCNGCGYMDSARSVSCTACGGTGNHAEATATPAKAELETCRCGWVLPLSVLAYPADDELRNNMSEENVAAGMMVGLVCPVCGRGHSFYTPAVARDLGLFGLGGLPS